MTKALRALAASIEEGRTAGVPLSPPVIRELPAGPHKPLAEQLAGVLAGVDLELGSDPGLSETFPFFVKGADDRRPRYRAELGRRAVITGQDASEGSEPLPAGQVEPTAAPRLTSRQLSDLRQFLDDRCKAHPEGKRGVAKELGLPQGTLRPFLVGTYAGTPHRVIDAAREKLNLPWLRPTPQPTEPNDPAGNPLNLDRAGVRYVIAGCTVELPEFDAPSFELVRVKVARVHNGQIWVTGQAEPLPHACSQVRVLILSYPGDGQPPVWKPA
jgi:hypothetical protein